GHGRSSRCVADAHVLFHDASFVANSLAEPWIGGVEVPDVTATFLSMSVSARARRAAVRIIGSAPKPVKRAAFGRPERRDGLVLHPDMQAMLALMRLDDVDPGAASFSKQ